MSGSDSTSALPVWGNAEIPTDRDRTVDSEERGFIDIIKIFIRSWPFMVPQTVGYRPQAPQQMPADSDASESQVPTAGNDFAIDDGRSLGKLPFAPI